MATQFMRNIMLASTITKEYKEELLRELKKAQDEWMLTQDEYQERILAKRICDLWDQLHAEVV